jgi:hypothetical protein
MAFAARGSATAVVVWLGMTLHLTYNTVLLLLGEPMNRLFHLYERTFAFGVASAIAVVTGTNLTALTGRFASTIRTHRFALYLWVIAGLNVVAWLERTVLAILDDTVPKLLDGTGTSGVAGPHLAVGVRLRTFASGRRPGANG